MLPYLGGRVNSLCVEYVVSYLCYSFCVNPFLFPMDYLISPYFGLKLCLTHPDKACVEQK